MEVAKAIRQTILAAENIMLVTHVSPDGDAIGSMTAMGLILHQLGKRPQLTCEDNVPARFRYLPLANQVQSAPTVPPGLIIALDCGDESRMGKVFADLPTPKPDVINIDHHVTNTHFGTINLIDTDANATVEILRLVALVRCFLITGVGGMFINRAGDRYIGLPHEWCYTSYTPCGRDAH